MSRLFAVIRTIDEIVAYFGVDDPPAISVPTETVEGSPGLIVIEKDGRRLLKSMPWGLPLRLQGIKPDSKPKPVNNIADLTKGIWIGLARKPQWRCLIPLTGFAEIVGDGVVPRR
ncbi:hypothetical protein HB775_24680 (plasmid) [Rhizobium leguminosarum bv. trifolii]|nr:hypothetical protein HB775_24680 [Rhizobium leguminosarum bv. trifolii]